MDFCGLLTEGFRLYFEILAEIITLENINHLKKLLDLPVKVKLDVLP